MFACLHSSSLQIVSSWGAEWVLLWPLCRASRHGWLWVWVFWLPTWCLVCRVHRLRFDCCRPVFTLRYLRNPQPNPTTLPFWFQMRTILVPIPNPRAGDGCQRWGRWRRRETVVIVGCGGSGSQNRGRNFGSYARFHLVRGRRLLHHQLTTQSNPIRCPLVGAKP